MNQNIIKIWDKLTPVKSVIYFLILLFFFHFSWKIFIDGDQAGNQIFFLGKEIYLPWLQASFPLKLTQAAAWFIRLFPDMGDIMINGIRLHYPEGKSATAIVWGCTGVKQTLIFIGIMAFYKCFSLTKKEDNSGYAFQFLPYWNKLWYIPLGCIILAVYNVIRIGSISMLIRYNPEKFDFYHDGIFRYIYYTIIFVLWVVWEEVYVQKRSKK